MGQIVFFISNTESRLVESHTPKLSYMEWVCDIRVNRVSDCKRAMGDIQNFSVCMFSKSNRTRIRDIEVLSVI